MGWSQRSQALNMLLLNTPPCLLLSQKQSVAEMGRSVSIYTTEMGKFYYKQAVPAREAWYFSSYSLVGSHTPR